MAINKTTCPQCSSEKAIKSGIATCASCGWDKETSKDPTQQGRDLREERRVDEGQGGQREEGMSEFGRIAPAM